MLASRYGREAIVEYLLAAGAEVNRQNKVRLYSSMCVGAPHLTGLVLRSTA
jgi:hypothetical protein